MFSLLVQGAFYLRFKVLIEVADHFCPVLFSLSHFVKLLFDISREIIVHNFGEVLHQEVVHHQADVGRYQLATIATNVFALRRFANRIALQGKLVVTTGRAFRITFNYILTVLNS